MRKGELRTRKNERPAFKLGTITAGTTEQMTFGWLRLHSFSSLKVVIFSHCSSGPQLLTHMKSTRDENAKPTTDWSCIRLRHPMQSFLQEIFLSGLSVDVFLITENLRNTAVQWNHTKPL